MCYYIDMIQGAFVPLTMEGNIMVDGVLASCHASIDHDLAHIGMMPIIWFPKIMELFFGREDEMSLFVKLAEEAAKWFMPYGKLYGTTF